MSSFSHIQKQDLLSKTKDLVQRERQITLELIEHLREIERRMLYAELGFGSLFGFCIKYLGLSEGSAQRRISAMRLSRDLPEVKEKLKSGELTLSNAAKIQIAFTKVNREKDVKLTQTEKSKVIEECTNRSQPECEKKLFSLLPSFEKIEKQEKTRVVNETEVELRIILDQELQDKIKELKNLLAHPTPTNSTLDLLNYLITKELAAQKKKHAPKAKSKPNSTQSFAAAVWKRAKSMCEFRGCNSGFMLEIDHIKPKSLGGTSNLGNLRLLCRTHNLQQAVEILGPNLMKTYVPSLR